jgi:hypothetical protein
MTAPPQRQHWSVAPGAIETRQTAWRFTRFAVVHTVTRGMPNLDFGGSASQVRRRLWLVLTGEAHIRVGGRERIVRAGEALTAHGEIARLQATSVDSELVQVIGPPGEPLHAAEDGIVERHAQLGHALVAELESAVRRGECPLDALRPIANELAGDGLDGDWVVRHAAPVVDRGDASLLELVARYSCALRHNPGMDDLAAQLAMPERRASERVAAYFARFHADFVGWRDYLGTLRAELGWSLLCTRQLASRDVAQWLGYRSAPALYHALSRRGLDVAQLPSPVTLRGRSQVAGISATSTDAAGPAVAPRAAARDRAARPARRMPAPSR